MDDLPARFVISKHPSEYFKQGLTHCGAYCVKGILSAYGKDDKHHPGEYHPYWLGKVTGVTLGWSYWPKALRKYGFEVEVGKAHNLSNEERLHMIKGIISKDNPVMLRIGNGYLPSGKHSSLLAHFVGHWITLWGYDDKKQVFYVYDSAVPKRLYDKDIPIGNKMRTYSELLRDWGTIGWTDVLLLMLPRKYFYIAPRPKS